MSEALSPDTRKGKRLCDGESRDLYRGWPLCFGDLGERPQSKFILPAVLHLNGLRSMYDVNNAPRRRIYANGYYSDWFSIKSGVAQGCPLSPLLFLVVGQALKIALDLQPGFKGIEINGSRYKLLQFADDTSLILGSIDELQHAERGILKWCKSSAMRENASKREGLGMGAYRTVKKHLLPTNIQWTTEGEWAVSLGVPVGNDLDPLKWWKQKLKAVRKHATRWLALYRHSYFGRNLIVQGMFFGRLRYWLFSLPMPEEVVKQVQAEADILWWSKEPDLNSPQHKRFRRFVKRKSAIGTRAQGGLGNMDFASHVKAFQAQWILRYAADPAPSSWKTLLDSFLLNKPDTDPKFAEGRGVFFCKLRLKEKSQLIEHVPKKAVYIRACIYSFWKLKIKQDLQHEDTLKYVAGESPWLSHRFDLRATTANRLYFGTVVEVKILSDLMHAAQDRVFTRKEWRQWIKELDATNLGRRVDNGFISRQAKKMESFVQKIPQEVIDALKGAPHVQQQHLKHDRVYALIDGEADEAPTYARYSYGQNAFIEQWVDALGMPHNTGARVVIGNKKPYEVAWWQPYRQLQEEGIREEDSRIRDVMYSSAEWVAAVRAPTTPRDCRLCLAIRVWSCELCR